MKKLVAEALGTFGLVLCGTGAIALDERTGLLGVEGIALVFGLIVVAMVHAFAPISGAHINPAVTVALAAKGAFAWRSVLPYTSAQLTGALIASAVVKSSFPESVHLGATIPAIDPLWAFALEVSLTFLLMLVVLRTMSWEPLTASIALGATVGLEAFFAGPLTGASMNPARTMAPALVSGDPSYIVLYTSATVTGAVLAVLFVRSSARVVP